MLKNTLISWWKSLNVLEFGFSFPLQTLYKRPWNVWLFLHKLCWELCEWFEINKNLNTVVLWFCFHKYTVGFYGFLEVNGLEIFRIWIPGVFNIPKWLNTKVPPKSFIWKMIRMSILKCPKLRKLTPIIKYLDLPNNKILSGNKN